MTVDDQTVKVEDLSQPVAEAPKAVAETIDSIKFRSYKTKLQQQEEVAPSRTPQLRGQTAETSREVAEAAPQATTQLRKGNNKPALNRTTTVEETTTPIEKSNRNNYKSSGRSKEASSSEADRVSTYQPEESKHQFQQLTQLQPPDYARIALAKSEKMQAFNHKQLPLKKKC